MSAIDWGIIGLYLAWIVWDGIRMSRDTGKLEGYFLASKSLPWWAVGLSVMATQLSAITMTSSTGQGYADGIGLLQQYYALPIAMIIISVTFVPFFRNANIYTAYEFLERRFDARVRSMTALLFLFSRGMSTGVVISAPAVVLSVLIGADISTICVLLAVPTAIYTMYGGVQAVGGTDVKQMYLIVFGLVAATVTLVVGLPDAISVNDALTLAGTAGKLQAFNFSTDPSIRFTFWTGTLGALFLFLSYVGTDQSQVQRYLTAKSDAEAQTSLFMSAYWKIPLQALVMIIGVLMFVFYLFTPPPMLFNSVHEQRVRASARAGEYAGLEQRFSAAVDARSAAAQQLAQAERAGDSTAIAARQAAFRDSEALVKGVRTEAVALGKVVTGDGS
ncbi:MAG: sodium:solute symporter family transporter [Acidimicrobiia bacterium]